jgi:hypothetical protein
LKPKGNGKQQVIVRFISRAKLIKVFKVMRFLKFSDTYRGVYITDGLTTLRYKIFDIVKKNPGITNVFTRDRAIHCTYNKKHVVLSSPDDLFHIDVEADLELLGLKHLI